ncbi:hypothetical protein MGI18_00450 [Bacillus sp. OVS6]|nr:hypothetical protein MGI18_00450 [Bacillus sp. OVS6]
MGIFSGVNESQFDSALQFEILVSDEIDKNLEYEYKLLNAKGVDLPNKEIPLKKIGVGHSLGGNLIQMLSIINGVFENVYAINDAPQVHTNWQQ